MTATDLETTGAGDLEVYEPGLSLAETLRGSFARFFPASALSLAGLFAVIGVPANVSHPVAFVAWVAIVSGSLAGGFGLGLEAMRRHLYPDASVDGRRSILAGLLSPLALFIVLVLGLPLDGPITLALFAAVGVVMAVVMFFAWLTPTPDDLRERTESQTAPVLPRGAS